MIGLGGVVNPFRHTVVTDPWHPAGIDVPGIHARAFSTCQEALEQVRLHRRSSSVLLHGEAGSGKTHLLARLRSHWTHTVQAESDGTRSDVVFIAVRLQVGPRRLWRYLRRSVAEDLLRAGEDGETQLRQMLLHRFAEVRPAGGDLRLWWQWLENQYPNPTDFEQTIHELFDRLDGEIQLGRDLCTVLAHLLLGQHRRDARAWLIGDSLPESALRKMNLASAAVDDDDDQEDQARRTVVALCHLSGPRTPVVLCFDQVEALQVYPKDEAGLFAFGQLVMALYQQTNNTLLISCIQSTFLEELRAAVRNAAWDRMAMRQTSLEPLHWDEAARLITSRLDAQSELARERAKHAREPLWPLDEARLRAEVGTRGCAARRVLALAADLFEVAARGAKAPMAEADPSAAAFLEQTWQDRLEHARQEAVPERADEILTHGLPLLAHCLGRSCSPSDHTLRDVDFVFETPGGPLGVSLCNQAGKTRGLPDKLRRLSDQLRAGKPARLVLIRDARRTIGATAKKTHERLEELDAMGARVVWPSAEAMAALQALRTVLADAQAGDLSQDGHSLDPKTVRDWLAAHLPASLRELVDEVVSSEPPAGPIAAETYLMDALLELLEEQHVIELAGAAERLGQPAESIAAVVSRLDERVGVLNGSPVVLFQLVPESASDQPE